MTDHIEEAIERLKQLRKVGFGYDIKDGDRAAIDVVIGALAEKDKRIAELERERDDATGTLRYCEKQWSDERGVMIDKFVYERNRADAIAEAAERQLSEIAGHMDSECDSDSILHGIRETEADRDIYKTRAIAAETEAATLRAMLEEAVNGNRPLPYDRDTLGRFVREAWVRWAVTQPNPKSSWLVPYDELAEPDKEADRQIGEALARWTLIGDSAARALAEKLEKETGNE